MTRPLPVPRTISAMTAALALSTLVLTGLPEPAAAGPAPGSGTFKEYEDLGSFEVGCLTFSNLKVTGGDLTNEQIMVSTLATGLEFTINIMTASMNVSEKSVSISFDVASSPGTWLCKTGLSFTGSAVDPGARSEVDGTYRNSEMLEVFEATPLAGMTEGVKSKDLLFDDKPTSLAVALTAKVSTIATGNIRAASINTFSTTYACCPEPGTLSMGVMGSLLLAGAVARGRGRSRTKNERCRRGRETPTV